LHTTAPSPIALIATAEIEKEEGRVLLLLYLRHCKRK